VHYGLTVAYEMWTRGVGAPFPQATVYAEVHLQRCGARSGVRLQFGDGCDGELPHTTVDIVGHELAHYLFPISGPECSPLAVGGTCEANADFWGTMTEYYANGGAMLIGPPIPEQGGNWLIGEGIGSVLRYMHKPSRDGESKDAWGGGYDEDPHLAAGPINRGLYFLSQGAQRFDQDAPFHFYSSPYLPRGMTGLGNQRTARIWRDASTRMTLFDPLDVRASTIEAATRLNGASSAETRAVEDAFEAVNILPTADLASPRQPDRVRTRRQAPCARPFARREVFALRRRPHPFG
jgi:Zn-dependent metalloprotease